MMESSMSEGAPEMFDLDISAEAGRGPMATGGSCPETMFQRLVVQV